MPRCAVLQGPMGMMGGMMPMGGMYPMQAAMGMGYDGMGFGGPGPGYGGAGPGGYGGDYPPEDAYSSGERYLTWA